MLTMTSKEFHNAIDETRVNTITCWVVGIDYTTKPNLNFENFFFLALIPCEEKKISILIKKIMQYIHIYYIHTYIHIYIYIV